MIRRVASSPSTPGMRMSISTTSGRESRRAAPARRRRPRLADHLDVGLRATGSSQDRRGRAPGRRRGRRGSPDRAPAPSHGEPALRPRARGQPAPARLGSLAHPLQARAARPRRSSTPTPWPSSTIDSDSAPPASTSTRTSAWRAPAWRTTLVSDSWTMRYTAVPTAVGTWSSSPCTTATRSAARSRSARSGQPMRPRPGAGASATGDCGLRSTLSIPVSSSRTSRLARRICTSASWAASVSRSSTAPAAAACTLMIVIACATLSCRSRAMPDGPRRRAAGPPPHGPARAARSAP